MVGLLALAATARAETPIPDAPARWVTDNAGFLGAPAAQQLDDRLAEYDRTTGHQVLVYIDHTTGGVPIEDWAVKAFERWRVGRKGIDDGVVLFVFTDDRRLRIEVGYGLEPVMPDMRASRIIREVITPRLQAGDRDGAIRAGADAIMATLGGPGAPAAAPALQGHKVSPGRAALGLLGILVVFILFARFAMAHPGLAWIFATMIGGGRRGGGWGGGGFGGGGFGGGGGFSGGGGRSGGGGASGSW